MPLSRMGTLAFGTLGRLRQFHAIFGAAALSAGCFSRNHTPPPLLPVVALSPRPLDIPGIFKLLGPGRECTSSYPTRAPTCRSLPVTNDRLLSRARNQCINFFVDQAAELQLRQGGVANEIVEALKWVCVDVGTNREEQIRRRALEQSIGRRAAANQYIAVAKAYIISDRFGPAQGEILEAIRLGESSELYFQLGTVQVRQQRCDTALQAFESAMLLDRKKSYIAYASAGRCFQLVHEWNKALAAYQQALHEWDTAFATDPQALNPAPLLPTAREWLLARIAEVLHEQ